MSYIIFLIFGCVVKIVQPTPILPEHYEIINEPTPERVVIKRVVVIKTKKRVVIKKKRRKRRIRRKKRRPSPKLKNHRPRLKHKQNKKRTKKDLPKKEEE